MNERRHGTDHTHPSIHAAPADVRGHDRIDARALCSTSLLNGRSSVAIDHEGTRYVLRATRTGKLILTK